MPDNVVNLRRARKARDRAEREGEAAANRAAHGRTKAERGTSEAEEALRERTLDAAKRED